MKRLLVAIFLMFFVVALGGCNLLEGDPDVPLPGDEDPDKKTPGDYEDRIRLDIGFGCDGANEILISGECISIRDLMEGSAQRFSESSTTRYLSEVDLLDDLFVDIEDSLGLAVVPRSVYEAQHDMLFDERMVFLSTNPEILETSTENVIVKLTESGFFETVSFKDSTGFEVTITSNPLVLEVYGAYTVVIFDVDLGDAYYNEEAFAHRISDSLYHGGVYLIHNVSGKVFATATVEFSEETNTWEERLHHTITTTANVGEPVMQEVEEIVYDENEEPVLDEAGNPVMQTVLIPVLDEAGEPLVFTEGPYETFIEQIPLYDYFEVLLYDDAGEVVLDEAGQPVYEVVEEPVLDDDGNQVYLEQESAVLDDAGNPVYQTDFPVEVVIEEVIVHTETLFYAEITRGPLHDLAARMINEIIMEYHQWTFYRAHMYSLNHDEFAYTTDAIYYRINQHMQEEEVESIVMRVSFDDTSDEIILEEYLNVTRAGLDTCSLSIDPKTENIICERSDANITIYSPSEGLKTIPDTENFHRVIFPNGELFFYTWENTYIEALGYPTRLLYSITADGTLMTSHVELGEHIEMCTFHGCTAYAQVHLLLDGETRDAYDATVDWEKDHNHSTQLPIAQGTGFIDKLYVRLAHLEAYDSTRHACTEEYGCWYEVTYHLYDGETHLKTYLGNTTIYPGETPPNFSESYDISLGATIGYLMDTVWENKVCDEADGCSNRIFFNDPTQNEYGISFNQRFTINEGAPFINQMNMITPNSAEYIYTKLEEGQVCTHATCSQDVRFNIYDQAGNRIGESYNTVSVLEGEIIPLAVEYHMSEDTVFADEGQTCTHMEGCTQWYQTFDGYNYPVNYLTGEVIYTQIDFADTDRVVVEARTLQSETCTENNGCYHGEVTYNIYDGETLLYVFMNEHRWVDYNHRLPYVVNVSLADLEIIYSQESREVQRYCESESCYHHVNLNRIKDGQNHHLASINRKFTEGEALFNHITILEDNEPFDVETELICHLDEGCYVSTNNYLFIDATDSPFPHTAEFYEMLPVHFAQGERLPTSGDFAVTFRVVDYDYRIRRMAADRIFNNLHRMKILEDDLFFIPRGSWEVGEYNIILTYDEATAQYGATYTNLPALEEIARLGDGYIGINIDKTAILYYEPVEAESTPGYIHFDGVNLTQGEQINAVNNLIIDYDGSIYFKAVDNFIQDITGTISADRELTIDTDYTEREIIRLRPIN